MLLLTKLQIPSLPQGLVSRPRLATRLHGWENTRLVTIVAPAGYGKTTFASDWIRSIQAQQTVYVGWISLDEDDNEPFQFVNYLAAALKTAAPGLAAYVQDVLNGGTGALKQAIGAICNALSEAEHPVILVLDDYHLLQQQSVHDLMDILLQRAPANFHCLLLARSAPPLTLGRHRVRGQLLALGVSDLSFTQAESLTFLAATVPSAENDDELAQVSERMGGWCAGVQLAALALRETVELGRHDSALPLEQELVAEYVVSEVLERLAPRVRLFLLQTAVLDVLSPPLCQAVTLQADSSQLLAQVAETTALVTQLDAASGHYRYHQLLRKTLLSQLELHRSCEERRDLHRRAAAWYATAGDIDSAMRHYEQAGDALAAIRQVEQQARPTLLRGDTLLLERWLARLPASLIQQRPRLALDSAWLSILADRSDATDKLHIVRRALAAAHAAGEIDERWQYELAAIEASAAFIATREDTATELALRCLESAPAQYAFERATCHFIVMIHYRRRGATDMASVHAERAIADYALAGSPTGQLSVLRTQAQLYYDAGRAAEAVHMFQRQLAFARAAHGSYGGEIVHSHVHFGVLCYQLNQIVWAREQFEQVLEYARRADDNTYSLLGGLWLKLCACAEEPWRPADQTRLVDEDAALRQVLIDRPPGLTALACWTSVWCRLREHNIAGAWSAAQAMMLNVRQPPALNQMVPFLAYMNAYVARGRNLAAIVEPLQWWEAALNQAGGLLVLKLQFRLLTALLYSTQGNPNGALKALDEALAFTAESGYMRFALDQVEQLRPLLLRSRHPLAQVLLDEAEAAGLRSTAPLLSEVELRVLRRLASGETRQAIAAALFISENTVKTHLKRIYGKLEAASRDAALAKAREMGLLDG